MSVTTLPRIQRTNTIFDSEIARMKEGKKEVSDAQYRCIWLIGFLIVGCLAVQNGLYGVGQGNELLGMTVLAILYCSGDFALSIIVSIFANAKSTKVLSFFAGLGLFTLSLTAGVSFLLSQQHTKDVRASRVGELEQQISVNREIFAQYHKTITAERIDRLEAQLVRERARVGANHSSSNAIYTYLSKLMGWSYEGLSLAIRTLWIFVFILTAMSLSALRGLLWSPGKELAACRALERKLRQENKRLARECRIAGERHRIIKERGASQQKLQLAEVKELPPRRNLVSKPTLSAIGAVPKESLRTKRPSYSEVLHLVTQGQISPKQRALTQLGMGAKEASDYLRRMTHAGVLRIKNRRGDLELAYQ